MSWEAHLSALALQPAQDQPEFITDKEAEILLLHWTSQT